MNSRPQIFRFNRNEMPFHIQIVEEVRSYFSNFNDRRVTRYIDNHFSQDTTGDSHSNLYSLGVENQNQVHTVIFGTKNSQTGELFDNAWYF